MYMTMRATGIGITGEPESVDATSTVRVFNENGIPYPKEPISRQVSLTGFVPFPGPSYTVCDENKNLVPPCPKSSNYRAVMVKFYTDRRIPIPTAPYEVHHIKPSSWGGGNSTSNLVILPQGKPHAQFTEWWKSFNARLW
jgi:hypothetical protein